MTGNQRQFRFGQVPVNDVQIGAADSAGLHTDQQLARTRIWNGKVHLGKKTGLLFEDHGAQLQAPASYAAALPTRPATGSSPG